MRLFFRSTLILLLCTGLGIIAARQMGKQRPASLFAALFTYPDGSPCPGPCLFGVQPGKTRIEDARAFLPRHPLLQNLKMEESAARRGFVFKGKNISVGFSEVDGRVALVDLQMEPQNLADDELYDSPLQSISMADMVAALGGPDYVQLGEINMIGLITRSYYIADQLVITHIRPHFEMVNGTDPFQYLFLNAQPFSIEPIMVQWRGFATLRHYLDASAVK